MVEAALSLSKARLKSSNTYNSSTMNPNTTWSGLLESYHPYLTPQKVTKNPQTYCAHNTLSKSAKSYFGCLRLLGVKTMPKNFNYNCSFVYIGHGYVF
jgi:hypothetical protein